MRRRAVTAWIVSESGFFSCLYFVAFGLDTEIYFAAFAVLHLFLLRLIHPSTNLVDCADSDYVTQFFLFLFISFSLLWNLENDVLLLFFSSVLSSDLVMSLYVHLSVFSILKKILFSEFFLICFFLLFLNEWIKIFI